MNTTTQQGKLTESRIWELAEQNLNSRTIKASTGYDIHIFARAIEAEVEARTAKKMDALVEALSNLRDVAVTDGDMHVAGYSTAEIAKARAAYYAAGAALAAHQQDTVAEKGEV